MPEKEYRRQLPASEVGPNMIVERASFPGNFLKLANQTSLETGETGKIVFNAVVKKEGVWNAKGSVLIEQDKMMSVIEEIEGD